MKKISLMILLVIVLQIVLPILTILDNNILTITSQAETDYSSIDLYTLEEIKDNQEALIQVKNIIIEERNKGNLANIQSKLELIALCSNVENIYICVNSLALDKTLFEYINSNKDVSLSISCGSIDFKDVGNANIRALYLSENKVYNFDNIANLKKLESLDTFNIDGFEIVDFDLMTNLEYLSIKCQKIDDYKTFFEKIKNVKNLSLETSNLQNSDTKYMKGLSRLESLNLYGTYVTDISFLKEITTLKDVTLPLNVSSLDILYDMTNLQNVTFDSVTELKVTPSLIEHFETNGISYPNNYDVNISEKVENLLSEFQFSENTPEEEKIRKITELVTDYMEVKSEYQEGYSTTLDKTINLKFGVCHDYALLEYTLLTMVGIDAYYVAGSAKDVFEGAENEYDLPGAHAWNMVKLNNDLYGIDAMWTECEDEELKERQMNVFYLKETKIEKDGEYPYYKNDEEYVERYFSLSHVTFNNPLDTLGEKEEKYIEDIDISSLPDKTNYIQNYEDLDLTGGILTITYNDETTGTISLTNENIHISGFDNTKIGTNTIAIEYEGKTTTFDVQIISKQAVGIEVTTLPTKKQYIQNYENLDLTGGILTITYNDETTDTISLTNENIHISGFDNTKIGTNTIAIEYEGKTTTFDVQIISKQAVGIEVTTLPTKKQYIQNYENLDLTGGILTITYNDETTDTISLTNENIHVSGFDNTKIGTNIITVEYEGKTTTFKVQILSKQITGIEVSKLPTKTKYIQNYENMDLTGGILSIVYNDKTTDSIDMTNENVKVSNFDNKVLGKNTLTVEYNGIKTNFDVEIISKSVTKIELTTRPIKTKYIQNTETIDLTGGVLTVTYDDKTTDTISLKNENVKVTGFNNNSVGNNILTIEYEGAKTSFTIEIISNNTEKNKEIEMPSKDKTVAVGTLPQTGEKSIIFIFSIIVSFILAILLYKKLYKKWNEYKNI